MKEMNITSAQYIKDPESSENISIKATIDGVQLFVPFDVNNIHYAEITRLVSESELTIKAAD
tara:strand:+ start:1377 stop:1562 length:186 start_codon:yes stop_codon:yes gene_type:complete